jgi:hypothetical protein
MVHFNEIGKLILTREKELEGTLRTINKSLLRSW